MDIGMLWYDDDGKRPLAEKVNRAVEHYKTKYRAVPTVCYVNPATLKDGQETAAGVQLRTARNVMVDHFWIGVGEADGAASTARNGTRGGARSSNGNGHRANGQHIGARTARKASQSKNGRRKPVAAAE